MSRIPRIPTAIVTSAALLATALAATFVAETTAGAAASAEPAKPILSLQSHSATYSAFQPAISSDGQTLAYRERQGGGTGYVPSGIVVQEDRGNRFELPDNDTIPFGPSISGDAGLVSFTGTKPGDTDVRGTPDDHQLYVVDRRTPQAPVIRQVTESPNDLPYLRVQGCQDCQARLSRDGKTLVAPVLQSVEAPGLRLRLDDVDLEGVSVLNLLIDLGAAAEPGRAVLTVVNKYDRPVVFPDQGLTIDGDPGFSVAPAVRNCAGTLGVDEECSVVLTYDSTDCSVEADATLRLPATTSAGQTALKLASGGVCSGGGGTDSPRAPAAGCTGPSQYNGNLPGVENPSNEGNRAHPYFALGDVDAGKLGLEALRITNSGTTAQPPTLSSTGCQTRLVVPSGAPADTCQPGQDLAAGASCTAYVEYLVPDVTPFFSTLRLGDVIYRVSGYTSRNVIAAWHDPSGAGNFGTAGPARIVSVDGPGNVVMDGWQPSISADGRWLAFTSLAALGRPPTDPDLEFVQSQVYLHDMDADGNSSWRSGQTLLISELPDGRLPLQGSTGSVSDDGNRIAFHAYAPIAGDPDLERAGQNYVVDRTAKRTALVTTGADGSPGQGFSHSPALSGDGSTVTYLSVASNLLAGTPSTPPSDRVYARDITLDLAGGRGANDLVSVRPDGTAGSQISDDDPVLDQRGKVVAFSSYDRLDDTADNDSTSDIYRAERGSTLTLTPPALDFGKVPAKTASGPKVITLRNDGPASHAPFEPSIVDKQGPMSKEFVLAEDQCTDRVLHAGQTCNYTVEFSPTTVGSRAAQLSIWGASTALVVELTGVGTSDARTTGETDPASQGDYPDAVDPAISDKGQFVAFRTLSADSEVGRVHLRDMKSGTEQQLSAPGAAERVGPPDISGSGDLVAYTSSTTSDDPDPQRQVLVSNRNADEGSRLYAATGTPSDLRYQRVLNCVGSDADCKPSLSGDGKSIAIPARMDTRAPGLSLTARWPDGQDLGLDTVADFGSGGTLRITVTTERPVEFSGPPVVAGATSFSVVGSTCTGKLAPDASCTVDVNYDSCAGDLGPATLRTQGLTPDGQTELNLVGVAGCSSTGTGSPAARAAPKACAPFPQPGNAPGVSTDRTTANNPLANAGGVKVGGSKTVALLVENTSLSARATVEFEESCDFALVTPEGTDPSRPACTDGGDVAPGGSCVAYVTYRPEKVGPTTTTLEVTGAAGNSITDYVFAGRGYQDVVVLRSDPSGEGDFAGDGRPAPQIISRNGSGEVMTGGQPSLSGDGRYVAFMSTDPLGRPATDLTEQVYRHDRKTGQTVLVSRLADDSLDQLGALYPSISRSGDRIAFETQGYEGDGYRVDGQVWVRDLPLQKTVLASSAHGKPGQKAAGSSGAPSLSADGTTVAFSSDANDLVDEPGNRQSSVYVRYLDPDFTGSGQRFTERVALTDAGAVPDTDDGSYSPSINEDGAFTAFDSESQLVATDTDELSDVYVRRRLAQLVIEPTSVDFGAIRTGKKTAAKAMTVRNLGMGPATTGPTTSGAPFAPGARRCTTTLHRGESCQVDATFQPVAAGRADGLLGVPSVQGYLPGPSATATLTGVGTVAPPVARFTITPDKVAFAPQKLGTAAPTGSVTVRNTGDVALAFTSALSSPQGDFGADAAACATLMPGAVCTVDVSFAPRLSGPRTGSLQLRADSQDPMVADPPVRTIGLSGIGIPSLGPTPVAAMTVTPMEMVYGPQILQSASASKQVVVTNTGTLLLAITARQATTDYISDASACRSLQPGKQCAIAVRFVPQGLGTRPGALMVEATSSDTQAAAPFAVRVGLQGTTAAPKLTILPPMSRPGRVVMVTGENFPPNRAVELDWQIGLGSTQAVADGLGRFETRMVIFKRDVLGHRLLAGMIPGQPAPILSPPLLVQALAPQAPDFVTRW